MNMLPLTVCLAATMAIAGAALADGTSTPALITGEYQLIQQHAVGLVPEGVRIDLHFVGAITDGLFADATVEGVDYLLVRHDGVGVLDVRLYAHLPDGTAVAWTVKGFGGDPTLMPPLAAWLDPDFEFPDADLPLHGAAWFQTMAPPYAHLNHTVLAFHGTCNLATGKIRAFYRPLPE